MAAYKTGLLDRRLGEIDDTMASIKAYCQTFTQDSLAGPMIGNRIIDLYSRLKTDLAFMTTLAATPGLGDYAREQKNDPNFDVVAAFNDTVATINSVTNWINTNIPKQAGTGYLLLQTLGANGPVDRTFTTAELAGLRTQIATIIAQIE